MTVLMHYFLYNIIVDFVIVPVQSEAYSLN